MPTLETRGLVIDVPGRADGTPLDLELNPGEVWAVLGPNGAGKTTLLHTLAGLRTPRRGTVLLDRQPLSVLGRRRIARTLAVVFQERQDGFPATVLEAALVGRHPFLPLWGMESADDIAIVGQALAQLDLQGLEQRPVATLSGGERQRLAIASALVQQPMVWLADEPTNHLDLRHQVAVMRLFRQQAGAGATVCMGLHDLNLAARWCSHVLLLYPDGTACWGDAGTMMLPSALERLYDQPLEQVRLGGHSLFLPVSGATPDASR